MLKHRIQNGLSAPVSFYRKPFRNLNSRLHIRSQTGDTIVEVLLCLAVIASVLTFTFVTVNKNSQAVRRSQERTEALQLAQGQVEILKEYLKDPSSPPITNSDYFCLDLSPGITKYQVSAPYSALQFPLTADDFSKYRPQCIKNNRYHLLIRQDDIYLADPSNPTYLIQVRWDGFGITNATNANREEIIIQFRAFQ